MSYAQQHVVAEGENPASSSYFNAEMTYMYNGMNTIAAGLSAHIADPTCAHDASAISVADAGDLLTATTVEAALAELHADVTNHTGDTSAAHAASAISVLDTAGNFTGEDVEAVLAEVQADLDGRFDTGTGHDHDGTDSAKIPESSLNLTDVTTGDVSTSAHGFVPKAPNDAAQFLNGMGAWATVSVDTIGDYDSDDTEYTKTGDTGYTLKKTFTFTVPNACFGLLYMQLQMKSSIDTRAAYVRFDLDDVAGYTPSTQSTSYTDKTDFRISSLTAGEHTLKVYLKTAETYTTAYMKLVKWILIGVKTA